MDKNNRKLFNIDEKYKQRRTGGAARRRGYLNDYHVDENGEYVYMGNRYAYDGDDRKKVLTSLLILAIISTASIVVPWCINAESMIKCSYVIFAHLISLICFVIYAWALVRMMINGDPLNDFVYKQTYCRLAPTALISFIGSVISIIGIVVFLVINMGGGTLAADIVCIALETLNAVSMMISYIKIRAMNFTLVTGK